MDLSEWMNNWYLSHTFALVRLYTGQGTVGVNEMTPPPPLPPRCRIDRLACRSAAKRVTTFLQLPIDHRAVASNSSPMPLPQCHSQTHLAWHSQILWPKLISSGGDTIYPSQLVIVRVQVHHTTITSCITNTIACCISYYNSTQYGNGGHYATIRGFIWIPPSTAA